MTSFRSAHATHDDWRQATESCLADLGAVPPASNLGFLYVTDRLAEHLEGILDLLRGRTGVADWVGTTGIGVAASSGIGGCAYRVGFDFLLSLVWPLFWGGWLR